MRVFVPFDAATPKTRLDPLLSAPERASFARAMLGDGLEAISRAGGDPTVVATAPVDCEGPVTVDERPLDEAINARLAAVDGATVAVVMADLPLANAATLGRLFDANGEVVLAPGLGGGTNAIVVRHPDFRVDYHGASIRDHRAIADRIGADRTELDSRRLATDVDEPGDLAEVLVHGEGRAADWLAERGFDVATADGRVTVER